MRRVLALGLVVVLTAGACSGGDDDRAEAPTSSTTTTLPDLPCDGIGPVPVDGEVTWIQGGRLWASTGGDDLRCLVRDDGLTTVAWGGEGDRVLVGGNTVVLGSGPRTLGGRDRLLSWSRPSGTSLLARAPDGAVNKHPLDGSLSVDLPLGLEGETLYHPSGVAIVATVPNGDADGLLLSSNTGDNQRWLVENETGARLSSLEFASDGTLYFAADHGSHHHVHRLDMQTNTLSTVVESPRNVALGPIAVSPFDPSQVAIARRDCTESVYLEVDAGLDAPGEPVGWLPDGRLVLQTHEDGCDGPGDLVVFDGVDSTVLASGVEAAAVRAVLPPPPPPPPDIDQAAPA